MIDFKLFQKPQRYIGNEWNVTKKNHQQKIKICLSYPDLYEVGMSNLGLRIIYGMLNEYPDVVCERVFMPGVDLLNFLKERRIKLFSLETKTSLDGFEVLGFNFNYELNFTNFLNILFLGNIPLKTGERKDIIVLGGGVANPEPLAEFVDVFYLGEFEEKMQEFVEVLQKHKDKESRLKAFSEIDGFYVPKFYSPSFNGSSYSFEKLYPHAKFPLKRVYVKNLDTAYYPLKWLVPYTAIIHDRVQVEIARGCPNSCSFCQARALYYPYRERKMSSVIEIAKKIYQNSGYENFSFLSLSASDYSSIVNLIDGLSEYFQERRIGLSLPSLRVDDIVGRLFKKLNNIKKTSLTLAIEAAKEELRNKMNKRIDINKFFEAIKIVRSLRVKHIKIYFMFGFPQEDEEDLVAIGNFLRKINQETKLEVNISINVFISKPFSSWEGVGMLQESILEAKRASMLSNIPKQRNIRFSISSIKKSLLEGILSRADRKFSSVIYKAFLKGAFFDGNSENFSWQIWEEAMKEERIDYRFYLEANTANFPWSFINK